MLSAGSLPKWKKRVSLHFVHFVTFRMKSAAELEALFIRAIRHIWGAVGQRNRQDANGSFRPKVVISAGAIAVISRLSHPH